MVLTLEHCVRVLGVMCGTNETSLKRLFQIGIAFILCYSASMNTILCYTAGAARGNPGRAAAGVYVTDEAGAMISETAEVIGNSTDVFAAYYAVMLGLQTLRNEYGDATHTTQFELCVDNELVKTQLNAEAQINEPGLVPMFIEIHNMRVAHFPHLTLTHISPEQNAAATRLVDEALDGQ